VAPSARTQGNGHKLKHRRFPLNIRKQFFTVRVTRHWTRLPRKVVESPSSEILKNHPDMILGSRFSRIGQDNPQRSLPTSTIL